MLIPHLHKALFVGRNAMNRTFIYNPGKGIVYNGIELLWGAERKFVRRVFESDYQVHDHELGGVTYHRDVYSVLEGEQAYFFFNYDSNNRFSEIEIHNGIALDVKGQLIECDMDFQEAVSRLSQASPSRKPFGTGEMLFPDLKLNICSGELMGAEDDNNKLSYIYCASDVGHLIN